jgi:hypothetical protein
MVSVAEYKQLAKKPRKQPEGKQQVRFGSFLKGATFSNNLIYYTYSGAGEKKPMRTAVNQKQKGLRRGDLDYRFEVRSGDIMRLVYIEFKSDKGSLTPDQKAFIAKHEGLQNAKCYMARKAEEGVEILRQEGIIMNEGLTSYTSLGEMLGIVGNN